VVGKHVYPPYPTKPETTIQKWGNGLGLRITKPLSQLAHFKAGTVVSLEVTKGGMMIKRLKGFKKKFKNPFSESDLVSVHPET